MDIDKNVFVPHVKQLYMAEMLHEITTGHSKDRIFEVETVSKQYILRISECNDKK